MKVIPIKAEDVMLTLAQKKEVFCVDGEDGRVWNLYYQEVSDIFNMMTNESVGFFILQRESGNDN